MKSARSFSKFKAALLVVVLLAGASCTRYNPALFTGYDILQPNDSVKKNPIGVTADGNFIVNSDFLMWVFELKAEVSRLRKGK